MATFKSHKEYCESCHCSTNGCCNRKISCCQCEEIWDAAFKSAIKIQEEVRKICDIIKISETGIVSVNFGVLKQKLLNLL